MIHIKNLHFWLLITAFGFTISKGISQAPSSLESVTLDWVSAPINYTPGGASSCKSIATSGDSVMYCLGSFIKMADMDPDTGVYNLISNATQGGIYFSKFDSARVHVFSKKIDGNIRVNPKDIKADSSGDIHIVGTFSGEMDADPDSNSSWILTSQSTVDIFYSKYNNQGELLYAFSLNGASHEADYGLRLNIEENVVYIFGQFSGTTDFDPDTSQAVLSANALDGFIVSYNIQDGSFADLIQYGGPGNDGVRDVVIDANGSILVTGSFEDSVDFDLDTLSTHYLHSNGEEDVFLTKVDSNLSLNYALNFGSTVGDDFGSHLLLNDSNECLLFGFCHGSLVNFQPYDSLPSNYLWFTYPGTLFMAKVKDSGLVDTVFLINGNNEHTIENAVIDSIGNISLVGNFKGIVDFDPSTGISNYNSPHLTGYIANFTNSFDLIKVETLGNYNTINCSENFGGRILAGGNFRKRFTILSNSIFSDTIGKKSSSSAITFWDDTLGYAGEISVDSYHDLDQFGDINSDLIISNSSELFVCGTMSTDLIFNPNTPNKFISENQGVTNAYFARYDSTGTCEYVSLILGLGLVTAEKISLDESNNIWVAGTFSSLTDFDPGPGSYKIWPPGASINNIVTATYLAKYSANGDFLHVRVISGDVSLEDIVIDAAGNGLIVGEVDGSTDLNPGIGTYNVSNCTFFAKYSATGDFISAYHLPGPRILFSSLIPDSSGGFYLFGSKSEASNVDLDFSSSGSQMTGFVIGDFVVHHDSSMNLINAALFEKSQPYGSYYPFRVHGALKPSGSVIVSGQFYTQIDLDPGIPTQNVASYQYDDIYLAELDDSLNFVLGKSIKCNNSAQIEGIDIDQLDNIHLVGIFKDSLYVNGASNGLALTSTSSAGNPFYIKFDPAMNTMSSGSYGASNGCCSNEITSFQLTPNGNPVIAGEYKNVFDFMPGLGNYYLDAGNNNDAYLLSLKPCDMSSDTIDYTLCKGDSLVINGGEVYESGYYPEYFASSGDCDSMVVHSVRVFPEYVVTKTEPSCSGDSNGVVSFSSLNPNTYIWDIGSSENEIDSLPAGNYDVVIVDSFSTCIDSISVELTQPGAMDMVLSKSDISCFDLNDGLISVQATGGIEPYSIQWSNGESSDTVSGLSTGTYSVQVIDQNGCLISDSTEIAAPSYPVSVSIDSSENVLCGGASTGYISIEAYGGTGQLSFLWSNGETDSIIGNLPAGNYSVTITDINGCTTVDSVLIAETPELEVSFSTTSNSCFGDSSASILASSTGGLPPYSYVWNTGATDSILQNLSAGQYTCSVTDAYGCERDSTITITQPDSISLAFFTDSVTCYGLMDGLAAVFATGGTEPYSYLWSGGIVNDSLENIAAGTYMLTLTDSNNCIAEDSISVFEPDSLIASVVLDSILNCDYDSSGAVSSIVTGGKAPYNYSWSTGETSFAIDNLTEGIYTLSVSDTKGCSATDSLQLQALSHLYLISDSVSNALCNGDQGFVSLLALDGLSPYSYVWSNNAGNFAGQHVPAGTHTVTVTDSAGCVDSMQFVISEPPSLDLSLVSLVQPSCFGFSDGSLEVGAIGGTLPYDYSWDQGNDSTFNGFLTAGAYTAYVSDSNDCSDTLEVLLTEPQALTSQLQVMDETCLGDSNGSINATISGGISPYNYVWNDPQSQTSAIASSLASGTYSVLVTDNNGCTHQDTATINSGSPHPIPDLGADTTAWEVDSFLLSPGSFDSTYSFVWQDNTSGNSFIALNSGSFWVIVTDSNGCSGSDTINLILIPTGIEQRGEQRIQIFPNPATDQITVSSEIGLSEKSVFELRDSQGKLIFRHMIETSSKTVDLELESIAPGNYFLSVISGDDQNVFRLIIL